MHATAESKHIWPEAEKKNKKQHLAQNSSRPCIHPTRSPAAPLPHRARMWTRIPANLFPAILDNLKAADVVQLLQASKNTRKDNTHAAAACTSRIRTLKEATAPLAHPRVRLPGFATPPDAFVEDTSRPEHMHQCLLHWAADWGSTGALHDWLQDIGLGAFSPAEAILCMNAWSERAHGTRLSDLLVKAVTQFYYQSEETTDEENPFSLPGKAAASLLILFEYNRFTGAVWAGDIAFKRRKWLQNRKMRTLKQT